MSPRPSPASDGCEIRPSLQVQNRLLKWVRGSISHFGSTEPLPEKEVLCSANRSNKEAAFCSDFVVLEKPSDGLEPPTPSL